MLKLGLVAGFGELPLRVLEYCNKNNIELFCVLINGFAEKDLYKNFKNISINIFQAGKLINFFKKNGVNNVVFAGAVKKPSFNLKFIDFKGFLLLRQILKNKIFGDNTVIETIVKFLNKYNINILEIDKILDNIKLSKGDNTNINSKEYIESIDYGVKILKEISKFDIGQSIVIQQKNVVAIEAMEGTAKLIERSKEIKYNSGQKPILVKIKKENQSRKIDLPTIGIDTIEQIYKSGFAGIAIDSQNCIVLSIEKVISLANKYNLFIYGI